MKKDRSRYPAFRGTRIRIGVSRGFTLLEVLMAVGLLAVTSALVISTMSGGLRKINWSGHAGEASMHAQSLLDTIGTMEFIAVESQEGEWEDGKYRYQLDIKKVPDPSIAADAVTSDIEAINPPDLYQVVLLVRWGDKPQEQLRFVSYKARQAEANNFEPRP